MPTAPDFPEPIRPAKRGGRMAEGAAVEEVPVWLEINHQPVVTWMCTPDRLEELALGWLAGEGYITAVEQVHLRPCATDLGFWAEIDPARVSAVETVGRRQVLASGCGAVGTWLSDEALAPVAGSVAPPGGGQVILPEVESLRARFKELFAAGERYRDTGGIHAAALTDGTTLRTHAEDIGRHNAVDKVIGAALLAGWPVQGLGLLVTGRISAELAAKAARAGLAWVATPSVPSTLAVEIGRRAGMVLVGRAVSGTPHIHCAG
jgi:FdhD protein